jgi:hypothetical protein
VNAKAIHVHRRLHIVDHSSLKRVGRHGMQRRPSFVGDGLETYSVAEPMLERVAASAAIRLAMRMVSTPAPGSRSHTHPEGSWCGLTAGASGGLRPRLCPPTHSVARAR